MAIKKEVSKEKIVTKISQLWNPLTEKEKLLLLRNITIKKYRKNEVIYHGLDMPGQLMFLIEGKAKVFKDGVSGRNQIIRTIKPGEFFGFRAYFAKEKYKTAATAFEAATVAFFSMDLIVEMMKENYHITFYFISYLSSELGYSDDRTVNLTQKHIRARLAEALLSLKKSYGVEEDNMTLNIHMSREDLANMSNMTTSNAIRTLSSFADEKLISIDGRKIMLLDIEEITRICQMG